jgi:MoaA/NifB/PqqE/SkfB family radical SAM enzyme
MIRELKELDKFHLNINIVATRENLPIIRQLETHLTDEGVSLHVDPLIDADMQFQYTDSEKELLSKVLQKDRINTLDRLDFYGYSTKKCSAGRNYINIMPNGEVYRCAAGFEYYYSPLRNSVLSTGPNAPYDPAFFFMGNIFDPSFRLDTKDITCELPCPAACDRDMAKIKFLD